MRAQNLYNGEAVSGCRFAFTLPVEIPVRSEAASPAAEAQREPNPNITVAS
jgi:hypothetical protein